jgi:hypothetical protein
MLFLLIIYQIQICKLNYTGEAKWNDIVVLCGGVNDVGRNNSSMALHQIMDFVANNKHANIVLIIAPQNMI